MTEGLQQEEKAVTDLPASVRSILQAKTGDAVFVVGPEGTILYWDVRAVLLTGIPARAVLGQSCQRVISPVVRSAEEAPDDAGPCASGCPILPPDEKSRRPGSPENHEISVAAPGGERRFGVSVLSVPEPDETHHVHLLRDDRKTRETLELARAVVRLSGEGTASEASKAQRREVRPHLTARQMEVLDLLARGLRAKDAGRELCLSEATIRNHIRAILKVFDAHSQLEALARAREFGLLARLPDE
ncbi:LuxR C-terminal-related transcriptional regulator [Rubrobacter radiotolerans]|nr:LuxR C-terminal-related transcriptional regulator [Rubrobacter radiotolerans]MDX5893264.1 LuxR C-terminal-related transcriptional regulator [Rubrobacter radiotolerans]